MLQWEGTPWEPKEKHTLGNKESVPPLPPTGSVHLLVWVLDVQELCCVEGVGVLCELHKIKSTGFKNKSSRSTDPVLNTQTCADH